MTIPNPCFFSVTCLISPLEEHCSVELSVMRKCCVPDVHEHNTMATQYTWVTQHLKCG